MNIIFMGTPDPAAKCLQALLDAREQIISVVTQPDRKKGRGLKESPSPVKILAEIYHIPVTTPEKVKDKIFIEKMRALSPDIIVVVAYGKILPKELIEAPKHGAINLHASLLPKYRGAAPIQWAIMKGETKTGVTVMHLNETLDTGDIILQEEVMIAPDDDAESLSDKLFDAGAPLLLKALQQIKKYTAKRTPQNDLDATYAPLITKETGEIDWKKPASEINDKVRALIPWPTAHTYYEGKLLKIIKAECAENAHKLKAGELAASNGRIVVGCGSDALCLKLVQLEGGRAIDAMDFSRGHETFLKKILPG